ncbi:hypothetical protein BG004_003980 [Podila humilis]|nr:hypothetical protein BG004_003980 [Podila humilis]
MSDISTNDDYTIQTLREQLAALQQTLSTMQQGHSHPLQTDAPRARFLVIPDELIEAMSSIAGKHFFTAPEAADDDDPVFLDNAVFPKIRGNNTMLQDLIFLGPTMPKRTSLATSLQDEFAAETYANISDPVIRTSILDFLQIMRSQLAITARQITQMRKDNFVLARGLKPVLEKKGKGETITQEDLIAQITACKEYEKACAPAKKDSSHRGDNRGRRGQYRNGYFNRQFQQPQPQHYYYQQQGQQQQQPVFGSGTQQTPTAG